MFIVKNKIKFPLKNKILKCELSFASVLYIAFRKMH